MIKSTSLILLTSTLAIFLTSCTSTKKIQDLLKYKQSVGYLLDSEPVKIKRDISVNLSSIKVDSSIRKQTTVIKETGWAVPLLIINIGSSRKMCYLGSSNYRYSWNDILNYNFSREAERSGVFQLDSLSSDYTLDLTINKVEAFGPYDSFVGYIFFGFGYILYFEDTFGPTDTEVDITYQLKRNGIIMQENTFNSKQSTEAIIYRKKNREELIRSFASSMAIGTSENFKNVIELIVTDLNNYFETE